jgi:hypothetical protein
MALCVNLSTSITGSHKTVEPNTCFPDWVYFIVVTAQIKVK